MTYCVGILLKRGLVFAADTRTNAGFDNFSTFRKLHVWEKPGDRVIVLLTAGNLAVTQTVVSLLSEEAESKPKRGRETLYSVPTLFQAARVVGKAIRDVKETDGEALNKSGESFSVSFILGGQIGKERPRLFQIYTAGNFIEASSDTPFFQIGEHKYGKPILDRVADSDMRLGEAAKMVLLSFDSTLRSNLSVGMPIDLLLYNRDMLKVERERRVKQEDPYFKKLSSDWSKALRNAFGTIEEFDI
jgi:putative proteasome-type protease